jgi:hypothetical protein
MMQYRLRDMIESLDYGDLLKLKRDIDGGSYHLKKLLKEKIKEAEKQHAKVCSVCSNEIDPCNVNSFTLIFGPHDFKKKATFCALDCLEYFLSKLKHIKSER